MRVLLTGASGFIGAAISRELGGQGAEVRAFCRSEPPEAGDWIEGDVTDPRALKRAIGGCDAVIHTAALYSYRRADAPRMHAVNVEGTRNVIKAAGERRLLVTSSSATCGPVPGRPATEDDAPPRWELRVPYKRTKLEAERLALAAGAVSVNPTTVVGPGDHGPTPSGAMVRDLVAGRMKAYLRGAGINVVAVGDVARGHALALEKGRGGGRYILGGENLWLREAFALGLQAVGRKPPRVAVPWGVVYGAALAAGAAGRLVGREPRLLVLDEVRLARLPLFFCSEKARAELGFAPGPAAEALASAAQWFAARERDH